MPLTVRALVHAPAAAVWAAYTTPADIVRWNAASDDWHTTASTVELRVGGAFSSRMEAKDGSAGFDFAGTYTEVVPHERLAYTMGDRAAAVTFRPVDGGTEVAVTFDADDEMPVEMQQAGWQAILDRFKAHVEAAR